MPDPSAADSSTPVAPLALPQTKGPSECPCPLCGVGRAMSDLAAAHDGWIEQDFDVEGNHAWLRDEVAAVLLLRRPSFGWRKRLSRVMTDVTTRPTKKGDGKRATRGHVQGHGKPPTNPPPSGSGGGRWLPRYLEPGEPNE